MITAAGINHVSQIPFDATKVSARVKVESSVNNDSIVRSDRESVV